MTTNSTPTPTTSRKHGGLIAGSILIVIGLFNLAAIYLKPAPELLLGALALIFMIAGFITRKNGLLIPGGILSGLTAGIYLVEGPYQHAADELQGGIFMLAFAGGFALITLLTLANTRLGARCTMVWPLIPAALMALVGGLLVAGNTQALQYLNVGWPLILIAFGVYLVLRRKDTQE